MNEGVDNGSGELVNEELVRYDGFPVIEALLKHDPPGRIGRRQPEDVEEVPQEVEQVRRIAVPRADEGPAKEQLLEALLSDPVMADAARRLLAQSGTATKSPTVVRREAHQRTKEI
jgi:hypothetical protein